VKAERIPPLSAQVGARQGQREGVPKPPGRALLSSYLTNICRAACYRTSYSGFRRRGLTGGNAVSGRWPVRPRNGPETARPGARRMRGAGAPGGPVMVRAGPPWTLHAGRIVGVSRAGHLVLAARSVACASLPNFLVAFGRWGRVPARWAGHRRAPRGSRGAFRPRLAPTAGLSPYPFSPTLARGFAHGSGLPLIGGCPPPDPRGLGPGQPPSRGPHGRERLGPSASRGSLSAGRARTAEDRRTD
jgi:hypothetical protein